jgi:hypothetical protein
MNFMKNSVMKIIPVLLLTLLSACANGKEKRFTGSTPANPVIRSFLGMLMSDSVDFIRWKLTIGDDKYQLNCNYGIGKPNTNGFYNGGKWVQLSGAVKEEKNYFWLQNGNKTLALAKLNNSLLHLVDIDRSLLAGNGGWSYTLNRIPVPLVTDEMSFVRKQISLKDSMAFHGRTPCLEFGEKPKSSNCNKMKWAVVLYADPKTNKPTQYFIRGTVLNHEGRTGTWVINESKDGRVIYSLNTEKGSPLYFVMPDENVFIITDKQGKLLIGDADFSYTLSRK